MGRDSEVNVRLVVKDDGTVTLAKVGKAGEDTAKRLRGLKSVMDGFGSVSKHFINAKTAIVGMLASLGGIAAVKSAVAGFIEEANKLKDMHQRLGESVEFLSSVGFMAKKAGIEFDEFALAIQMLNRNLGDAKRGAGSAVPILKEMGVYQDVLNGKYKTAESIMPVLAKYFYNMADAQKASSMAADLIGRSGGKMVQVFRDVRGDLEGARAAIIPWSKAMAESGDAIDDAWLDLQRSMKDVRNEIVMAAGPAMIDTMGRITEELKKLRESGELQEWGDRLGTLFDNMAKSAEWFARALDSAYKKYEEIKKETDKGGKTKTLAQGWSGPLGPVTGEWYGEVVQHTTPTESPYKFSRGGKPRPWKQVPFVGEEKKETGPGKPSWQLGMTEEDIQKLRDQYMEWKADQLRLQDEETDKTLKKYEIEKAALQQIEDFRKEARDAYNKGEEEAERIRMENQVGTEAWFEWYEKNLRQQGVVDEEVARAVRDAKLKYSEDWEEGVLIAQERVTEDFGTRAQKAADIWQDATQSMTNHIDNFMMTCLTDFENIGQGFRDMAFGFAQDLMATLTHQAITVPLVNMIMGSGGGIGGVLGKIGGAAGGAWDFIKGIFGHEGGMVTDGGIRKYHSGGPVPGSGASLGVLQGGEYVIPKLHSGYYGSGIHQDTGSLGGMLKGTGLSTPAFGPSMVPAGSVDYWKLPQFGFYGTELLKNFDVQMQSDISGGIPYYYYAKYGPKAESMYLTQLIYGMSAANAEDALADKRSGKPYQFAKAAEWMFGGGIGAQRAAGSGIAGGPSFESVYEELGMLAYEAGYGMNLVGAMRDAQKYSTSLELAPGGTAITEDLMSKMSKIALGRWLDYMAFPFNMMHSGGMANDEFPAVLQTGEAVLSREMVARNQSAVGSILSGGRAHDGGMAGGSAGVMINVINRSEYPVAARSGGSQVSPSGFVQATIVVDNILRSPRLRGALGI